jgi:hypothetical protein
MHGQIDRGSRRRKNRSGIRTFHGEKSKEEVQYNDGRRDREDLVYQGSRRLKFSVCTQHNPFYQETRLAGVFYVPFRVVHIRQSGV